MIKYGLYKRISPGSLKYYGKCSINPGAVLIYGWYYIINNINNKVITKDNNKVIIKIDNNNNNRYYNILEDKLILVLISININNKPNIFR